MKIVKDYKFLVHTGHKKTNEKNAAETIFAIFAEGDIFHKISDFANNIKYLFLRIKSKFLKYCRQ